MVINTYTVPHLVYMCNSIGMYHLPCSKNRQTQGFGSNHAVYKPLKGHPATDWAFTWNEPIPFIADSFVYAKLNEGHKDPMKYTGVCTIVETGKNTADEIIYGHPNTMPVEIGKSYFLGETVALAGNKGFVQYWGRTITKEEKLAGSTLGTHLHLQRRPCLKVKKTKKGKRYLETSKGKFKKDGYYYEIANYNNGYAGCEDIQFNGKVAVGAKLVPYEEALASLKRDLKGVVLTLAINSLNNKYGKK